MAVTLPSDLIADVMRNADAARRGPALARLQSLSGDGERDFAAALNGLQPPAIETAQAASFDGLAGGMLTRSGAASTRGDSKASAFAGFEHMVLRNLFETLLPDEKSGAFGGGPSAGVWRSLAADQFAGVYTKAGGIGLTHMLAASQSGIPPGRDTQWPYFTLDKIHSFAG